MSIVKTLEEDQISINEIKQKKFLYLKNNEEEDVDEFTFQQLKLLSKVLECCIEKCDKYEKMFFHERMDRSNVQIIVMFIKDRYSFFEKIERFDRQELFNFLKICYYFDINDIVELLTEKIASDIYCMNKQELEEYFLL